MLLSVTSRRLDAYRQRDMLIVTWTRMLQMTMLVTMMGHQRVPLGKARGDAAAGGKEGAVVEGEEAWEVGGAASCAGKGPRCLTIGAIEWRRFLRRRAIDNLMCMDGIGLGVNGVPDL
jgi:hypothetical protein